MEWLAVIGSILSLAIMIMKEFFSEKAKAEETDKQFKLDQAKFFELAQNAIQKMREQARKEAHQAQDVEDQVDASMKGGNR